MLGAQKKSYDARDLDYRKLGTVDELPTSYTNPYILEVFRHDQAGTPTCGAHAGVHAKQLLDYKDTGNNKLSPTYLWKKIKGIDTWPPDVGTDIRAICKALKSFGVCSYKLSPSNRERDIFEYSKDDTTVAQNEDAQPRVIGSYAFTGGNRELIKRAVKQNGAAILLIRFDKDYFKKKIVTSNGQQTSGHFVVAYGWEGDDILVVCSAHGSNSAPYKVLKPSFSIEDGAVLTDIPDSEVRALIEKRALLQKLVELLRKLTSLTK